MLLVLLSVLLLLYCLYCILLGYLMMSTVVMEGLALDVLNSQDMLQDRESLVVAWIQRQEAEHYCYRQSVLLNHTENLVE